MTFAELFILAIGLSMDAFAVSVCKGLAMGKTTLKASLLCGVWFGGFQAAMPLIGYFLGARFEKYITSVDHWIAFALLAAIGASMLKEAFSKGEDRQSDSLAFKAMLALAVATSIDALAVGVTFAFLRVSILPAVLFIGATTFVLSFAGVKIGNVFGAKYRAPAQIFGGVILILLGVKILLEHLGVI